MGDPEYPEGLHQRGNIRAVQHKERAVGIEQQPQITLHP